MAADEIDIVTRINEAFDSLVCRTVTNLLLFAEGSVQSNLAPNIESKWRTYGVEIAPHRAAAPSATSLRSARCPFAAVSWYRNGKRPTTIFIGIDQTAPTPRKRKALWPSPSILRKPHYIAPSLVVLVGTCTRLVTLVCGEPEGVPVGEFTRYDSSVSSVKIEPPTAS